MDYWKHALLSQKKFGGRPPDYVEVHKFMDSSKLFFYNNKHRLLLHNLVGIEFCCELFDDFLVNSDHRTILIRDIAAEHCKEDLDGRVPPLQDWIKDYQSTRLEQLAMPDLENEALAAFVFKPLLRTGLKSAMIITATNFGIHLVERKFGIDTAMKFSKLVEHNPPIHQFLEDFTFQHRWQYTPDKNELIWLKELSNGNSKDQKFFN